MSLYDHVIFLTGSFNIIVTRREFNREFPILLIPLSMPIQSIPITASSLVASVGNRDQWKNNRSAMLNGNAIESEATRKSRIQDGVHCIKWPR